MSLEKTIYLDAPNVGALEKKYLCEAVDSTYVSTIGPFVSQFEDKIASYLGMKRAVAVQSGTAAIHIALLELGIGAGDEVIVPALTFVATINPVLYVGATPVIVDVDPQTWNIKPELVEAAITSKTKAIIPVHLFGNPCQMDAIMAIAKEHSLYVIEDATESLGATYNGQSTGTMGDFGCFSFNGNKTITTGGGGVVVGSDEIRLQHIKFLVNQAREEQRGYYHPEVGYNYRMTNIEAALGLAQMERLPDIQTKKQKMFDLYVSHFKGTDIVFQAEERNARHSHWMNAVRFPMDCNVEGVQRHLREKGIQTRRLFMPLDTLPPYGKYTRTPCLNAAHLYEHVLCLPSSTTNDLDDIALVVNAVREGIAKSE